MSSMLMRNYQKLIKIKKRSQGEGLSYYSASAFYNPLTQEAAKRCQNCDNALQDCIVRSYAH